MKSKNINKTPNNVCDTWPPQRQTYSYLSTTATLWLVPIYTAW